MLLQTLYQSEKFGFVGKFGREGSGNCGAGTAERGPFAEVGVVVPTNELAIDPDIEYGSGTSPVEAAAEAIISGVAAVLLSGELIAAGEILVSPVTRSSECAVISVLSNEFSECELCSLLTSISL